MITNSSVILLVEDNPSDVDLTIRALNRARVSNKLVIARDGQEALEYIFGTGPYAGRDPADFPAVILLDLKLPRVDGLEVLYKIRNDSRTRRAPVVILTSSREEQDVAQSYDFGVNSYIRKPVDFIQFSAAVANLCLYWLVLNEPPPLPK